MSELARRTSVGIILIAVALASALFGGTVFAVLVALIATVMYVEWTRMVGRWGFGWKFFGFFYCLLKVGWHRCIPFLLGVQINRSWKPEHRHKFPGGGSTSSWRHLARTVCRRAERRTCTLAGREPVDADAVRYLNRLSDALYVFGRWNVRERGESEPLWTPEST